MGNKVVVKGGSSKELTPHSLFFLIYIPGFNKIVFFLALALLKASSKLSELGKRKLIE